MLSQTLRELLLYIKLKDSTFSLVSISVSTMPLGSVQEWRARIGSSWCALGRAIKSAVSGGGPTRQLCGEAMLQVLYVLMMLTLVVVIQRIRKINKCVSGYHMELRSKQIYSRSYFMAYTPPLLESDFLVVIVKT